MYGADRLTGHKMSNITNNNTNGSQIQTGWKDGKFLLKEIHYIILAVLIIVVNACVIIAVWRKRILHKWQNYLLVSLACSDLSTGLLGLPISLLCSIAIVPKTGCIFCTVSYLFTKFISISTILHLLTVTYERFLFIVYPFHYERLSAKHVRFKMILAAIWCISLAVALIPFIWTDPANCSDNDEAKQWLFYTVTTLIVFLIIPMVLLIVAFVSMFLVAKLHIRRQEMLLTRVSGTQNPTESNTVARKEARVAIIFALMWAIFVICWGPYFALSIIDELDKQIYVPEKLWQANDVLRLLTSLLNPLLYSFLKKDFCQALSMTCCTSRTVARGCCVPYNRRCIAREEVQLHSNAAQRLSETGHHALVTQVSTI